MAGPRVLNRGARSHATSDKAGGHFLGPVGGQIVAEVLVGILWHDHTSYLYQDSRWTPARERRRAASTQARRSTRCTPSFRGLRAARRRSERRFKGKKMPDGFEAVPDWFSLENQGAGIAVANLGGQRHLVVMMVDDGPQQNRGLYRLGRNLDAAGKVTGPWTQWLEVPDWFSWDNQAVDVAVADLTATGGADLVTFMIDNGPQQNRGLYRVGKGLDVNGAVTGGWTLWIDVPDWFSWDNQGGGIAVTPPDATGERDLVVFMIDNGTQQNRGLFRVGKGFDANGVVAGGWTPWIDIPDWFSWENQGGSIAVADLEDGSRDLIVFMIDNTVQAGNNGGQNQGFFKIGRKLGADGMVANWNATWSPLPFWFSWENQGGGIDVANLGAGRKLLSLMVDNPPGQNAGLYQVLDFSFDRRRPVSGSLSSP